MSIRIIPRLDIKGPNLVKGVRLEGLRVLGKPEDYARYYYENGADELIYIDSVASLYGRNNLVPIIERTAKEIFIPLTVGGGLRTTEDIQTVLRAGADKVSLNTAAVQRPELIREAARKFGSSTIVVSITCMWQPEKKKHIVYTDYGRQDSGVDALEWAIQAAALGAGELLVTSIDREGTRKGFDLDLIKRISESVGIPVIACGGAGQLDHIAEVITQAKADAVGIASLLHYTYFNRFHYDKSDFEEGNVEFLRRQSDGAAFKGTTLPEIKDYLVRKGIECRYPIAETFHART